jgi:hypothetical protein
LPKKHTNNLSLLEDEIQKVLSKKAIASPEAAKSASTKLALVNYQPKKWIDLC